MVAAVKSSGITDLKQISEQKRPVRMMVGVGGDLLDHVLEYYGMSEADIVAWGGKILQGNALLKNPDFDIIIGMGVLANNPEGNMWYEMTQKKNLRFFPIPEDLRQKLVKEDGAESVDLPFRYMRGVGDAPIPTVGHPRHRRVRARRSSRSFRSRRRHGAGRAARPPQMDEPTLLL